MWHRGREEGGGRREITNKNREPRAESNGDKAGGDIEKKRAMRPQVSNHQLRKRREKRAAVEE
jgi:hypothetical protein